MGYSDIITMEPGKRGGKPCIRGLRVTVYDVLEYLAAGMQPLRHFARTTVPHRRGHSRVSRVRRGSRAQAGNHERVKLLFDENLSPRLSARKSLPRVAPQLYRPASRRHSAPGRNRKGRGSTRARIVAALSDLNRRRKIGERFLASLGMTANIKPDAFSTFRPCRRHRRMPPPPPRQRLLRRLP